MKQALLFSVIGAGSLSVIVAILLIVFQRKLIYYPDPNYRPPASIKGAEALEEFPVVTEDGLALKAWYAPAPSEASVVVYFHGNGDRLATAAWLAAPFTAAGYGFLLAEYRGYSGLPGTPSETGLYADGRAYIKGLIASGVPARRIILVGHSLGTGVAVQLATEFPVQGVILAAPYRSLTAVARAQYPFLPVGLLLFDRFASDQKIARIHAPLLIIHGEQDYVIPVEEGKALYALAAEPKQLVVLADQNHNTLFRPEGFTIILVWIARLSASVSN